MTAVLRYSCNQQQWSLELVWQDYIPTDVSELYEIRDFHHATAILAHEFPTEFAQICTALRQFRLTTQDIIDPGGNESKIPKLISAILRPLGWQEQQLTAEAVINGKPDPTRRQTHKPDYMKGRVAFDLEWNSKDQTFDRTRRHFCVRAPTFDPTHPWTCNVI